MGKVLRKTSNLIFFPPDTPGGIFLNGDDEMQVKSDVNCELQIIKVSVKKEGPYHGRTGTIIGTNKKSMQSGRLYKVRLDTDSVLVEFDARDLTEIKTPKP
jgi:hypothetical protein